MNLAKVGKFLRGAALVLYIIAFVLNIVFDVIAKNDVLEGITDKLSWILFGFILGGFLYGKRSGGNGNNRREA